MRKLLPAPSTRVPRPLLGVLLLLGGTTAAVAAPVQYEMDLRTYSGIGAGGITGIIGSLFGSKTAAVSRLMDLRLTNPSDIPDGAVAEHVVPEGMRIGPALPLAGERRTTGGGGAADGPAGEPEGKVLIYWGCGETVPKGQPLVIDLKAMAAMVPPEVMAMARQSRAARGKGEAVAAQTLPPRVLGWPAGDRSFRGIPAEASAVGEHVVKGSFFSPEIRYALGAGMDFLEPMNLKAQSGDTRAAVPLGWDRSSRARGFNLNAVGAVGEKEMVLWMAAKDKNPMLPASQVACTIPAGIFEKAQMGMVMGEVVGPSENFAFPPQKPGDKKPLQWTAKVRVSASDTAMLGIGQAASGAAGDAAGDAAVPGGGAVFKAIKGIFGQ